jgi:hypothetical protein
MEWVLFEQAFEVLSWFVKDHSFSVKHALLEDPFVTQNVVCKLASTLRFSIDKLAFVFWGIIKFINAFAMRHAIFPLSFVKGFSSIKNPITVDLTIGPITFKNICIQIVISSFTMSLTSLELSFVSFGVRRYPDTLSVVLVIVPLSKVNVSIVVLENTSARSLALFDLSLVGRVKLRFFFAICGIVEDGDFRVIRLGDSTVF